MSQPASPSFDFSGASFEKRFRAINRDRLRRVHESLSARQRDFVEMLPLLFHHNHPLLPGYVTKDTPFGIPDYAPSQVSLRAVRRLCRSFELDRRSPPRYAIRGLYMMGSPGTIAYSRSSDLDLWLLHDPDLPAAAIAELTRKASRVEDFAADLGLEVHFFVFDAERFRKGETLSLSAESSGSSQHCVLLDEFYRSGLLVAGLPPLWWRVPADYDLVYDDYVRAASARRIIDLRDYIDFGGLPSIPAAEFFGAAVWQLYKSIDSPYKSVLKLLLMEAYAAEYPDITLLCTRFKQAIESGQADLNALDPYILMYTKVEEYLRGRDDSIRLDVLRRCFYLKANVRVSELDSHGVDDWRGAALRELVAAWAWSQGRIVLLDQRDHWRLAVAIDERRDLTNTLKESYACLSRFARNHAGELTITEEDLHILGRKLYAAFEKKPSKIDLVTRGICSNPREPTLSLHEVRGGDEACVWLLYAGTVTPAETAFRRPLKRSASAAEIVLWCHLNRLADLATTWHVFTVASALNGQEVRRIHQLLEPRFGSDDSALAALGGELAPQPRIARVLLLVNVGVNPFSGTLSSGDVLTSDRNDPFQFGGRHINLVRAIDLLFMTTWNEAFAFRYTGDAALLDALGECVGWQAGGAAGATLPEIEARCFSVDHTQAIALRVQTVFVRGLRYLARRGRGIASHFVVETADTLQHIQADMSGIQRETHASTSLLMHSLGQARGGRGFNTVCFDTGCTRSALLAALYRHNRPRAVQIFAQPRGDRADVYILDERGVLLAQRQDCHTLEALFAHYRQFLDATLVRLRYARDGRTAAPEVETCAIVCTQGRFSLQVHSAGSVASGAFLPLQVLADADSSGRQQFTVIAGQREFSTWEHGGSLFVQVAEYILAQRHEGQPYPIYITDLDLSTRFRQVSDITTLRPLDLLRFKKRIEHQLTRALHRDVAANLVPLAS